MKKRRVKLQIHGETLKVVNVFSISLGNADSGKQQFLEKSKTVPQLDVADIDWDEFTSRLTLTAAQNNEHFIKEDTKTTSALKSNHASFASHSKNPNAFLIRALLQPEEAEDAIANLEHFYQTVWLQKHEPKTARTIFYIQNARVILGYYAGTIRSALELYLKMKK